MLTRFRLDFQTSEGGKRRYQHTIDDIIPNKKIQTEEEATENQSEKSISPEKTDLIGMNPNQSSNQTLPASSFPSTMPSLNDQMSRIREAFLLSRLSTVTNPNNILLQAKLQEHAQAQAAQRQVLLLV